jgi:ketosteroid isomerase-like protein
MSENLDLVRSICAPWEHGDYSSAEWAHPEIEVVSPDGPTPGIWSGLAGMAEGYRQFLSAWNDVRTDVEEYRELDDARVLVFTHTSGRGKTSGLELGPISATTAVLFHIRNGKVTKLGLYFDRDRALADLGLQQ